MDKKEIKKDFANILNKVSALLVWGSCARKTRDKKSDIDICVVAGECDPNYLYYETLAIEGKNPKYDIKIFELLPLWLKIELIKKHEIVYAKDKLALYEYFYFYRKLWAGQEIRMQTT
jgi:hypothetical protein